MEDKLLASSGEKKFFSVIGALLCLILLVSFVVTERVQHVNNTNEEKVVVGPNPFNFVRLTAKAAYVLDARTGKVLYAKDENSRLPLASLTKVMTALVATEDARPDTSVTITSEAIASDGDSGLRVGERWPLKNLLDFSLITSSNDGARAIALAIEPSEDKFIQAMNKKADEIGMKNTYFFNDTGLDESTHKGGAYGSARDMATLFAYILRTHPNLFDATRKAEITVNSDDTSHIAKNTDQIVNLVPELKASKTGFTDLAGGNLAIAFDPEIGRPIVITVLGSTESGRFDDVEALVNASLQYAAQGEQ